MSTLAECNRPSTSAQALVDDQVEINSNNDAEVVCLSSDTSDVELVEEDSDLSFVNKDQVSVSDGSILDMSKLDSSVEKLPQLKCLFKNHFMEPLTFIFLLHDFALEMKLTQLVEECGGVVYNKLKDIDGYTIVTVKDNSLHWPYLGPVFKLSFVQDCMRSKRILNITSYFKNSSKYKFTDNFNYMSVIYFKKYTWDTIPEKFHVSKKCTASPAKNISSPIKAKSADVVNNYCRSQSISSDEDIELERPHASTTNRIKQVNKHTRMLYSRKEDESILNYIVNKRAFGSVKGVLFWKTMEAKNVCPKRTWQSMKERFMKSIVLKLNDFKFLEEKHIKELQEGVMK